MLTTQQIETSTMKDNTVLDIYTEVPNGPDFYTFNMGTNQCGQKRPEGTCYNREHIVPQSLVPQTLCIQMYILSDLLTVK
jgi:hypothetical protein